MNKKRALITGITGQDGSYLAELLLEKDYEVWGLLRRHSTDSNNLDRIKNIKDDINLIYGDLTDITSIQNILIRCQPHEIYNLGAQSHVKISYENPILTANITAMGVLNLLEAIRNYSPNSRLYQASTSEMFGNSSDDDGFQRETTPFKPANPYAVSKLFAHNMCINYRNAYKLFISNGILFNHESYRRGENFVTSKVVREAVKISLGLGDKLQLGTLSSSRDWGHAKDYVRAMWMILQHNEPDDFICATGINHTIKDLCEYTFNKLGLNYLNYVSIDDNLIRPEETKHLKGDSSKIRTVLGWSPTYTFESMIDEMILSYKEKYSTKNDGRLSDIHGWL